MKFWFSGEVMGDVSVEFRSAILEIEDALNAKVDTGDYGIFELTHISIIRDIDHPDYCEVKKYSRLKKEAEFRLKIDYLRFQGADPVTQRKLLIESVIRAIRELPFLKAKGVQCENLERDVASVANERGWS